MNEASPKGMKLPPHPHAVRVLAFSPAEDRLATASLDGTVRVWSLERPTPRLEQSERGTEAFALAFQPNGSRLAIARSEGLSFWSVGGIHGSMARPSPAVGSPSPRLTWSADGHRLLVRDPKDDKYRLWTISSSESPMPARDFDGLLQNATTVAFSPDGRWLVARNDKTLIFKSLTFDWEETMVHEGPVERLDFGLGVCLTQSSEGLARLWDLDNEGRASRDEPQVSRARGTVTAPERSATSPGGAWQLDVSSNVPIVKDRGSSDSLARHEGGVTEWAFSGDDRWLVTGDQGGNARLWSLPSEMVWSVQHLKPVTFARFSPDSRRLITLGGTAVLWRPELNTAQSLDGHGQQQVTTAGFSPDSRWLATADDRGRVLLWDLSRDVLQAVDLPGAEGIAITRVQVDSTARKVFADDERGNRWEWRMDLDELIDLACRTVGRNLRREEWNLYIDDYDGGTCPDFPPAETR